MKRLARLVVLGLGVAALTAPALAHGRNEGSGVGGSGVGGVGQGQVDARDDIDSVGYNGGQFAYEGRGRWTEYGTGNTVKARFIELGRTADYIDLDDPSRNLQIRLALRQRVIQITERHGPFRFLYGIQSIATAQPQGGFGGNSWHHRSRVRDEFPVEDKPYDDPAGVDEPGGGHANDGNGWQARGAYREIDTSFIFNEIDAKIKCGMVAQNNRGTWTGKWWTKSQGTISTCEIQVPTPK